MTERLASVAWVAQFEGRYGEGAFDRLLADLHQPCISFADIAARVGVTRECVRQWHRLLMPDAPAGHERQRLCAQHQRRRRLFQDSLFRAFFRHARAQLPAGRVEPIPAKEGYRTRTVLVDKRPVALREGQSIVRYRGTADFIYVRIDASGFLFLPSSAIPATGLSLSARSLEPYASYRNSFAALTGASSPGGEDVADPADAVTVDAGGIVD